jgi:dipeptidase D
MSGVLDGLQPEKVFYYFEELSKIPRCSTNEKQVSDYLYQWASGKNLEVFQDEALNILIKKPGTAGYENSPTVILQGHMDMVCEKNLDTVHDFLKDPLQLRIVEDHIYASGTTLGADNGIAVAYAMAILDSSNIPHPPLEVLITTDEENGMTGVEKLNSQKITGRILINMDSGEEGIFTAGCAGGGRVMLSVPVRKVAPKYKKFYKLTIKGLKGGHSGIDIHKERGNSNKLLGRVLYGLRSNVEIAGLAGGSKANAIPRESWAILAVNNELDLPAAVNKWQDTFKHELMFTDADISVTASDIAVPGDGYVYDEATKKNIIHLINLIPNGPIIRNLERNMVVHSNNLGVIAADNNEITFICSPRSSIRSLLDQFINTAEQIGEILNIKVETTSLYPGWEYAKESRIRDLCLKTYEALYGVKGRVYVIHAGLECGYLMEKIPGLDAISMGPNMYDIHSPREHLSISSARRTFEFLCEVLKQIK